MTDFAECSMAMQDFLMILLEICLILELILPGGKRISANAPDVSGQCFDGSDGGIVALSLLGNLERETQISPFSVLLVCE